MDTKDITLNGIIDIDDQGGCNTTGATVGSSGIVAKAASEVAGSENQGIAPSRQNGSTNGPIRIAPARGEDKTRHNWNTFPAQQESLRPVHGTPEASETDSTISARSPQRASSAGNPGTHSQSATTEKRKCPLVEPLTPLQNDLMEGIVQALEPAWQKLLRNDGSIKESLGTPANGTGQGRKKSPGVDRKSTVEAYSEHRADPEKIARELRTGYVPSPIKRVSIPKESGGERLIGIPIVRDRVVHTATLMVVGPQIDKGFSEASHGFRRGRNTFTAARQALAYIKEGAKYAVKIDFCKCFDEIDHAILMRMIRRIIPDLMVSQLIEDFVKAEVMLKNGTRLKSNKGVHQGTPMGPFLTNVYLHVLDMELARRNLKHIRYADDVIVLTDSKKAADRVLKSITTFASRELNLRVNLEKSKTMPVHELEFLGFAFNNGIMIGRENLEKFECTVKWMTRNQTLKDAEENLERFKLWLTRWLSHFGWTDDMAQVIAINAWVLELLRQRERAGIPLIGAFRQAWEQSVRRHGSWKRALAMHGQSIRQK